MSKAAGDSVTVVRVASEAGLGLETEVPVPNAEVLALMRMSIGKAEVFADVAEAYARALADGWTLPRIGRAYDTYRREYAASHTDGRYIMSLPKFLAAGNGLRFYDLRADLVDSGAVAAAEEKAALSKAPTREAGPKVRAREGLRRPRPGQSRLPRDRPRRVLRLLRGHRLGPRGRRADRPMEERREHLAPQARAALRP